MELRLWWWILESTLTQALSLNRERGFYLKYWKIRIWNLFRIQYFGSRIYYIYALSAFLCLFKKSVKSKGIFTEIRGIVDRRRIHERP
jgi:hypothetical protein